MNMASRATRRHLIGGFLTLAFAACAAEDSTGAAGATQIVVRDSAGVRIVVNPPPSERTPRYSIAQQPSLVIGTPSGDSAFVLHRVQDVRFLSDHRIVAANGDELLWFHADGRFQARAGGRGSGPSEFRGLIGLGVLEGDTLLALNQRPPSLKVFTPTGQYARSSPVPRMPVAPRPFSNGRWVGLSFLGEDAPQTVGVFREQWAAVLLDSDLVVVDTLLSLEGRMLYGDRRQSVYVPSSPRAVLAARGDRAVGGSSDRYELNVLDSTGRLVMVLRNTARNPAVVPAARDDARRPEPPPEGGVPARRLEPPPPESAPAYDAVVVANDGSIWVRRYDAQAADREWHIYDRDGHLSALLTLPENFRPTEITRSHLVLGIWRDSLDVESIRAFQVIRPT